MSEEYDRQAQRLVGNFPQAFTHVALVNTILNYSRTEGPAKERGGGVGDSDASAGRGAGTQDPQAVATGVAPR